MQCADARSLIDRQVSPGAADPLRATLGFHLAACSSCRAYQTQAAAYRLLHGLLAQPVPDALLVVRAAAPPARRNTARRRHALGATLLVSCACATVALSQPAVWATASAAPTTAQTARMMQARSFVPAVANQPQHPALDTSRAGIDSTTLLAALLNDRVPASSQVAQPPLFVGNAPDADLRMNLRGLATARVAAAESVRLAPEHHAQIAQAQLNNAVAQAARFAPGAGIEAARSQLAAFEQAGPQALPPQLLQAANIDMSIATMALEAGQTIFLPNDPVVPEPPPPVIEVPGLPEPPAPPAPPRQPTRPVKQTRPVKTNPATMPKPVVTRPVAVVQPARRYVIQPGDTLSSIALRFYDTESSWQRIYAANSGVIGNNPNLILPNQQLIIPSIRGSGAATLPSAPAPAQPVYTVRSGDTLSAIALARYGNANLWPLIYAANRGTIGGNPDLIFPQQQFTIPRQAVRTPPTGAPTPAKPTSPGQRSYSVQPGDSLRGISLRYYDTELRWQEIYRANSASIPDPDRLRVGINLVIP